MARVGASDGGSSQIMIEFECDCGNVIRVPKSPAYKEGTCPGCQRLTRVPSGGEYVGI